MESFRLRFSREEVNTIASLYPERSYVYLDAEATEDRAKSLCAQTRYLHFATHGLLDERFPLNSALVLAIPENHHRGKEMVFCRHGRFSNRCGAVRNSSIFFLPKRNGAGIGE